MRKSFLYIMTLLLVTNLWAEMPQKMSYQSVLRRPDNSLIAETQVGLRISIIKDSATGSEVYNEMQTPKTNANGLLSIEFGGNDGFDRINWATGRFFLKTEIDPNGGSDYTIVGTSQMLAVPYALYAKRAGNAMGSFSHYVGQLYGGGVVFHVYKDTLGDEHGLICSMADQGVAKVWSNVDTVSFATSEWDGLANTLTIINQKGHTQSAALLCHNYVNEDYGTGVYNDWYLPAFDELVMLYNAKFTVNRVIETDGKKSTVSLAKYYYWSSTEASSTQALYMLFLSNYPSSTDTKYATYNVRAIRRF